MSVGVEAFQADRNLTLLAESESKLIEVSLKLNMVAHTCCLNTQEPEQEGCRSGGLPRLPNKTISKNKIK